MLTFWDPDSLPYVIDWSAWVTLVVGIAAVAGAIAVGKRQADIAQRQADIADRQSRIMERQTEIAARQVEIEQTRLRAELYDRRVVVYAGIDRYLIDASTYDGKVSDEVRDEFFKCLVVSRYLFGVDVHELCRSIHSVAVNLRGNMDRFERLKDGDNSRREALINSIESNNDNLASLSEQLGAVMERYLRLSDAKIPDDISAEARVGNDR